MSLGNGADASDQRFDLLGRASFETLLEQLPVAVVFAVAPSGRIVLANRAARELFSEAAVRPGAVQSYDHAVRLDGTTIEPHDLPIPRALSGQVTDDEPIRFRMPEGDWRTVEVRAGPIYDDLGRVIAAVSTSLDVSEQKRRELADREFAANAAHQLRTPLAAIRSAIEVLQSGGKEDAATRDRFLAHIERESARLTRLARALLVLARAQAMVESPRREIVPLAPLLHELAVRVEHASTSIEVSCDPGLAALANAALMEEALTCLVDNAVRHGRLEPVTLRGVEVDGSVAIEVQDRGPGMPAEVQQRVYERFYRTGEGSGFGLGLAIASQAAEAMDARLEIESPPEGTIARLTMPAATLLR